MGGEKTLLAPPALISPALIWIFSETFNERQRSPSIKNTISRLLLLHAVNDHVRQDNEDYKNEDHDI